jgi:predicted O-methyltransferase YrrM
MSFKNVITNLLGDMRAKRRASKIVAQHPRLKTAFSIKSHVTPDERYTLFTLAENKKNILEIGSYLGCSACCFGARMAEQNSGTIYCIDTWNNDAMTEGEKDTFQTFRDNTKEFTPFIVPVRGFSTDVVPQIRQSVSSLDLLFIDGDHSYEGAKNDWEAYKDFLHSGSVVVFHDFGWAEGVKRVIEEDVKPRVGSFNNLPNLWWGTLR